MHSPMRSGYRRLCFVLVLAVGALSPCFGQSQKSPDNAASQDDEPVYEIGPGVTPPRVVKQVNPQYSESSKGVRVTGTITIQVIVSSQGMPKDPRIIHGIDEEVDPAALEALKQWRFAPAKKDSKPVAVRAVIEVNFHGM